MAIPVTAIQAKVEKINLNIRRLFIYFFSCKRYDKRPFLHVELHIGLCYITAVIVMHSA